MSDETQTDATKALADVKGVIASLPAEEAKVKVFWEDYPFYAGIIVGVLGMLAILFARKLF